MSGEMEIPEGWERLSFTIKNLEKCEVLLTRFFGRFRQGSCRAIHLRKVLGESGPAYNVTVIVREYGKTAAAYRAKRDKICGTCGRHYDGPECPECGY